MVREFRGLLALLTAAAVAGGSLCVFYIFRKGDALPLRLVEKSRRAKVMPFWPPRVSFVADPESE